MLFKNKTEAYTALLYQLTKFKDSFSDDQRKLFASAIATVRLAIEDHEQDVKMLLNKVTEILSPALEKNPEAKFIFDRLCSFILTSPYGKQTLEERFSNPLARRFESESQIALLLNPTTAIKKAVKEVSKQIADELESAKALKDQPEWVKIEKFLKSMQSNAGSVEHNNWICAGSFEKSINIDDAIKILREHHDENYISILLMHFKFALHVMRYIPLLHTPNRTPCGHLLDITKNMDLLKDGLSFADAMRVRDAVPGKGDGYEARRRISCVTFVGSDLYKAERRKGRSLILDFNPIATQYLGCMFTDAHPYVVGLPKYGAQPFYPDRLAEKPNLESQIVRDFLLNDTVFVSGPSGMCSLMLGCMENLANFETVEKKQLYLAAVCSYIVGCGFHGIGEVLGPAAYALKLIPGYKIAPPDILTKKLGEPQNFSCFFQLMLRIDSEYQNRYERSWDQYLKYFSQQHIPFFLQAFSSIFQQNNDTFLDNQTEELKADKTQEKLQAVAEEMQMVLSAASVAYFARLYTEVKKGSAGAKLAIEACLEKIRNKDIFEILKELSILFSNHFIGRLFIGFLRYELRYHPELIKLINKLNTSDTYLTLELFTNGTMDPTTEDGNTSVFFKNFQLNPFLEKNPRILFLDLFSICTAKNIEKHPRQVLADIKNVLLGVNWSAESHWLDRSKFNIGEGKNIDVTRPIQGALTQISRVLSSEEEINLSDSCREIISMLSKIANTKPGSFFKMANTPNTQFICDLFKKIEQICNEDKISESVTDANKLR